MVENRTKDEIQKQITGLKKLKLKLPKYSQFGNPNHESIDAQIAILKGEKTVDDFNHEDDDNSDSEYIRDDAQRAEYWLNGKEHDDLF